LYFLPLPHQHGSLRPTFCSALLTTGVLTSGSTAAGPSSLVAAASATAAAFIESDPPTGSSGAE
jgi:hypothetical protein